MNKWQRGIERLKRMPMHWKLLIGGQFIVTMYLINNRLDQMVMASERKKILEDALAKKKAEKEKD